MVSKYRVRSRRPSFQKLLIAIELVRSLGVATSTRVLLT